MIRYVWIGLIAFVVVYGTVCLVTVDRRSDGIQIRSLVADAAAAVGKRDLNGTICRVSKNYKDPDGTNYDRLRVFAAQALRIESDYRAGARITRLELSANDATVDVRARVKSTEGPYLYNRDITLRLHKERDMHGYIIPVGIWRITSIKNLGINFEMQ